MWFRSPEIQTGDASPEVKPLLFLRQAQRKVEQGENQTTGLVKKPKGREDQASSFIASFMNSLCKAHVNPFQGQQLTVLATDHLTLSLTCYMTPFNATTLATALLTYELRGEPALSYMSTISICGTSVQIVR